MSDPTLQPHQQQTIDAVLNSPGRTTRLWAPTGIGLSNTLRELCERATLAEDLAYGVIVVQSVFQGQQLADRWTSAGTADVRVLSGDTFRYFLDDAGGRLLIITAGLLSRPAIQTALRARRIEIVISLVPSPPDSRVGRALRELPARYGPLFVMNSLFDGIFDHDPGDLVLNWMALGRESLDQSPEVEIDVRAVAGTPDLGDVLMMLRTLTETHGAAFTNDENAAICGENPLDLDAIEAILAAVSDPERDHAVPLELIEPLMSAIDAVGDDPRLAAVRAELAAEGDLAARIAIVCLRRASLHAVADALEDDDIWIVRRLDQGSIAERVAAAAAWQQHGGVLVLGAGSVAGVDLSAAQKAIVYDQNAAGSILAILAALDGDGRTTNPRLVVLTSPDRANVVAATFDSLSELQSELRTMALGPRPVLGGRSPKLIIRP